jgi:hypothetical protein
MEKQKRKPMTKQERERYSMTLMLEMSRHVGRSKMVGMGELYERVFSESWAHRINDTRRLRMLVTDLRGQGVPIVSVTSSSGGGYYLASAGSELTGYCRRLRNSALKKLVMEARLRKMSLPELMGQMALEFEGRGQRAEGIENE